MSTVTPFVGNYAEGNGSLANGPFVPATNGVLGMQEISGILKQIYDGQKLAKLYYKNNPAYAMLRKKEDFYGETYPLPVMLETPTGVANVFANAQLPNQLINGGSGTAGNMGPAKFVKFMLTRASLYGVHVIDRQAMLSASNNIGAFVNGQMAQMDAMIQATSNLAAQQVYRSGSGSIGQISSIASGSSVAGLTNGQIQLTNPSDIRYFTVGQVVYATNKDPIQGATSVTQRAGVGYVTSLNRANGLLTVGDATSANPNVPQSPTAWTTSDFIQISGTSPLFGPTISSANQPVALSGFSAWIGQSQTIGSADVFFGVNRSQDTWRLAGGYYDGSTNGQSVEEALYDASTQLFMEGGTPNICFVGPNAYAALQKSMAARNILETEIEGPQDDNGVAHVFFKGINIQGAGSNFTVIADRNCPPYTAYIMTMDDWALYSLKSFPHVVDDDGVSFLRQTSADAFEFRLAGYGQVGCNAPGHSLYCKLGI
jgi:hypothetical protein